MSNLERCSKSSLTRPQVYLLGLLACAQELLRGEGSTNAEGDPSLLSSRSRVSSVISTVNNGQQLPISSPKWMTRPTIYNSNNNNSSMILSSTQRRRQLETVIDTSGQQVNFSYDTTFSCPATVICHPICVDDVANCPVDAVCPDNYQVSDYFVLEMRIIFYSLLVIRLLYSYIYILIL